LAAEAFAAGADVIFHAAGGSGHRMFEIARRVTEDTGVHRWVIGVDFDEYQDVEEHLRPHVLASIRKQVPMSVYREIKRAVAEGRIDDAPWFDLSNGGMSLATTGGHVDHLAAEIEAARADIIARGPASG
jgi:basic membrane protein A